MADWDDALYLKFADERTRPARELLARAPLSAPEYVVDLGCGPGNSTALLRERWPAARLSGVDSSVEMLRRAREDAPGVDWVQADVASWQPTAPVDVLFANAVLHWLPEHATLFPSLFRHVRPGGIFAVQMPHNFAEPSHRLMRELPGPFARRTQHVRPHASVYSPAFYYDLLIPEASRVDIWQTTYEHVMLDAPAIVEWVKGTGLRPFLDVLPEDERSLYLERYTQAIEHAYPPRSDGKRLFSFPRLFILATR
jgi:trans-aconitate 2-methyltransferase